MRPGNLDWDEIPEAVRRELGVSGQEKRTSSRVTAWKDIPSSWGQCRPHGMTWWPKSAGCVRCEYPDAGDEGTEHVEEAGSKDLNQ